MLNRIHTCVSLAEVEDVRQFLEDVVIVDAVIPPIVAGPSAISTVTDSNPAAVIAPIVCTLVTPAPEFRAVPRLFTSIANASLAPVAPVAW